MVLRRIVLALSMGVAVAVISAVLITIVDIYLSGHGYAGLTLEYFTWSAADVHLSMGEIIMLSAAVVAAVLAWKLVYGHSLHFKSGRA